MFGAVELVERVHQSDYARVHQVFERHVPGQPLVDAARQVADLGQLFEQDAVSLFLFLPGGIGSRCILAHGIITSRQNSKFVGVRQHTQNGVAHLSHRSQFFSVFRFRVPVLDRSPLADRIAGRYRRGLRAEVEDESFEMQSDRTGVDSFAEPEDSLPRFPKPDTNPGQQKYRKNQDQRMALCRNPVFFVLARHAT